MAIIETLLQLSQHKSNDTRFYHAGSKSKAGLTSGQQVDSKWPDMVQTYTIRPAPTIKHNNGKTSVVSLFYKCRKVDYRKLLT